MANLLAIHSVGESLRSYLEGSYPADLRSAHPCTFTLASSAEMSGLLGEVEVASAESARLVLFLYGVSTNTDTRNSATNIFPGQAQAARTAAPLVVDLHFLISVTGPSAMGEHAVLAFAMRQLATHPVFEPSSLTGNGGWAAGETVRVSPEPLTIVDQTQIWTALRLPYRASAAYLASGIRIDADATTVHPPVLTRRLATTPGSAPA